MEYETYRGDYRLRLSKVVVSMLLFGLGGFMGFSVAVWAITRWG